MATADPRRGLLKDLLYTRNNVSLDIARLCSLISVVAYWGGVITALVRTGAFDPLAVGSGCAAVMAGCAGWVHFRQKHETGKALEP